MRLELRHGFLFIIVFHCIMLSLICKAFQSIFVFEFGNYICLSIEIFRGVKTIDGLDTYKFIVEIHPGQKAIIASGYAETDRVKKAQGLGAGAYVEKP